jgi:DNA polymerase III subunit delta'
VPLIPLFGHETLQKSLKESVERGTLPASILLHGPRGVGKQRLAHWLAQLLLCTGETRPCGVCQSCRNANELRHPDIHWFFPRPRLKDSDPDAETIRDDIHEAIEERQASSGLYAPASGSEGLFVATVRALVQTASMKPALGARKVFIVGDAERMVAQEGADQAANAFLKLLEEPPADTTIIITSSEPGALLPTVRSRVAPIRVTTVSDADVRLFLGTPAVTAFLEDDASMDDRVRLAAGAPGRLLAGEGPAKAMAAARKLYDAATGPAAAPLYATSLAQGAASARGVFSDILESLIVILNERTRAAVEKKNDLLALRTSRAVEAVARAQQQADGNVNPQLITAKLLRELRTTLQ